MKKEKKVLIISHNEICYNPRLAKAGDYLTEKNCVVTIFNPITGAASKKTYTDFIKKRTWEIIEYDISKRTFRSKINWLISGIINYFIKFVWSNFRSKLGFNYFFNKGLIGFRMKENYDIIIIHLIDSLPFAAKIKKRTNCVLIYDSQEYFQGQYSDKIKSEKDWVNTAEGKCIDSADIVITTTNVMKKRLISDYNLKQPVLRVRNTSYAPFQGVYKNDINKPLKIVWTGMRVYYKNRRGLHILLEAVSKIKSKVIFTIQGNINKDQKLLIEEFCSTNGISKKVKIITAAGPDEIVESLTMHDIGLIGELPAEDNQRLTSSNKLFDYIAAGLAVIAPDLPGLSETIQLYNTGLLYDPGNSTELAEYIDKLNTNPQLLKEFKKNSRKNHQRELYWKNDYNLIWNKLEEKLDM